MASLSQRRCFRFFEKNFLRIFFNHAFGVTEPKKAPYATTGEKNAAVIQTRIIVSIKNIFEMPVRMDQGTGALHHTGTQVQSGNHRNRAVFDFGRLFFFLFLAKQKKKKKKVGESLFG